MSIMIAIASLVSIPLAYLIGRRNERLHRNRRLDFVLERSYLNRTYYGRCHERL
jgi:membrane protein DedA with SNARE-associated domain